MWTKPRAVALALALLCVALVGWRTYSDLQLREAVYDFREDTFAFLDVDTQIIGPDEVRLTRSCEAVERDIVVDALAARHGLRYARKEPTHDRRFTAGDCDEVYVRG